MLKNVIIAGLSLVVILLWMKVDPECVINHDDPNAVTIEYQCSDLSEYESVPTEVVEECRYRANQSTNRKITLDILPNK
jgi:hypothetical protein